MAVMESTLGLLEDLAVKCKAKLPSPDVSGIKFDEAKQNGAFDVKELRSSHGHARFSWDTCLCRQMRIIGWSSGEVVEYPRLELFDSRSSVV